MGVRRAVSAAVCGALAIAGLLLTGLPQGAPVAHSFLEIRPASSTTAGAGLTPEDIASAYALSGGLTGGVVAIATAYSDPHLESDLATYRSAFGLPACGTADGCLTIAPQSGSTSLPRADAGWGEETSLDVDAVSAACPDCRILVVEAQSASIADLGAAVNTAVSLGAGAVSASWGDTEWSGWSSTARSAFSHPGVPVVAATGDDGYEDAVLPAALPAVIAVGGTTLTSTSGSGSSMVRTKDVEGGSITEVAPSRTVAEDKVALAKAKAALTAAKRHVTTTKATLRSAKAHRAKARTAHDVAHWNRRVRDLTRYLAAAVKAEKTAAKRVSAAESTLLQDVLRDANAQAAAKARSGQTGRTGWIETAWSGAGSGCSASIPKPDWQPGTTCARRGTADVAADADPQTGIAMFDTYGTSADTPDGWLVAGGTSLAAPLVAAMLVRSGDAANYSDASPLYTDAAAFWDITGGSNGSCGTPLCVAGTGYDGPTGVGTPRSLASF